MITPTIEKQILWKTITDARHCKMLGLGGTEPPNTKKSSKSRMDRIHPGCRNAHHHLIISDSNIHQINSVYGVNAVLQLIHKNHIALVDED